MQVLEALITSQQFGQRVTELSWMDGVGLLSDGDEDRIHHTWDNQDLMIALVVFFMHIGFFIWQDIYNKK